jgi:hypothetical protein
MNSNQLTFNFLFRLEAAVIRAANVNKHRYNQKPHHHLFEVLTKPACPFQPFLKSGMFLQKAWMFFKKAFMYFNNTSMLFEKACMQLQKA